MDKIILTIIITITIIVITISCLKQVQILTGHTKAWSKTTTIVLIKEYYQIITITIITLMSREWVSSDRRYNRKTPIQVR